jgi:hypothetical protein
MIRQDVLHIAQVHMRLMLTDGNLKPHKIDPLDI